MSASGNGFRRSIIFRNVFMGIGGLAMVLISVLALNQSLTIQALREDLAASRRSGECRFDVSADVDSIEGAIDVTVAQIIVAAVTEDEGRVQALGTTLSTQIDELSDANEAREDAVTTCSEEN